MNPAFRILVRPGYLVAWAALTFLAACAPTRSLQQKTAEAFRVDSLGTAPAGSVNLRAIFVIHGDADYTYHDSTGSRLRADRMALKHAVEVAQRGTNSEVFIFHQKTHRTGTFHHYRAATLVGRADYAASAAYLESESAILRRDKDTTQAYTVLAFFGHEIPSVPRKGYFASKRSREFSLLQFSEGLGRLGGGGLGKPYDLVILSACYGGTPATLQSLTPLANRVVASPAYLHLSYLNVAALGSFAPERAEALADSVAVQSFAQLQTKTQTEITVGIYDVDTIQGFLMSPVAEAHILKTAKPGLENWKDCANTPGFDSSLAARGVTLFYRPPRFGPLKNTATRSAWQCSF